MQIITLALALLLSIAGNLYQWRHSGTVAADARAQVEAVAAQAQHEAEQAARDIEAAHAKAVAEIANEYERGKTDAQATADRVAADLRAGTVRLRAAWAGCETDRLSAAVATAAGVDAAAGDRDASAGRIVRAAAAADAQIAALQALVRADRERGQ